MAGNRRIGKVFGPYTHTKAPKTISAPEMARRRLLWAFFRRHRQVWQLWRGRPAGGLDTYAILKEALPTQVEAAFKRQVKVHAPSPSQLHLPESPSGAGAETGTGSLLATLEA